MSQKWRGKCPITGNYETVVVQYSRLIKDFEFPEGYYKKDKRESCSVLNKTQNEKCPHCPIFNSAPEKILGKR